MRVLVTGADGFLGSNLVRELRRRDYVVRAMLEHGRDSSTINDLPLERVYADLLDRDSVAVAAEGCDAIIHAAANTSIWPPRSERVWRVNVDGTESVLHAARVARVRRLVHVGTANTFAPGTRDEPGDETGPYVSSCYGLDYMDSKYVAHHRLMDAARRGDVPAIEVNPTFMWGPFDRAPGAGKMILRVCRGEVPGASPGGRNCIAVKDVVVAMANALTMGRVGESYILGNRNLSYAEIFTTISRVVGVPVRTFVYPRWFVRLSGRFMSLAGTVLRHEPLVTRAMAQISCDEHFYTAAKAVRELGLPRSPVEEGIAEAHEWFLQNGYLFDENGRMHRRLPTPRLVAS